MPTTTCLTRICTNRIKLVCNTLFKLVCISDLMIWSLLPAPHFIDEKDPDDQGTLFGCVARVIDQVRHARHSPEGNIERAMKAIEKEIRAAAATRRCPRTHH